MVSKRAVRTNTKISLPLRLKEIYDAVKYDIARHRPRFVAVEEVFGGKNIQSTLKIGQARGAAVMAAVNSGVEVVEYSPAEVKMSVVGRGNASKEQVQFMVKNLLGLEQIPVPHDCADALAAALCHSHKIGLK